jgi:SPP1 gp7 family putative phage head morphogenesis protein
MREFKEALAAREVAQMQQMATAWSVVERSLQGNINALLAEIETLSAAGETLSRAKLLQMQRYQTLVAQVQVEMAKYVDDFAAPFITAGQSQMAGFGLSDAVQATRASYFTSGSIGPAFSSLPVGATEFMAGLAGDGSPLVALLESRIVTNPTAIIQITDTLLESTALGINPRVTARLIRDQLAGNLNKAMQIARTEQLRVYRESSRLQYQQSGVVTGYMRLSARDDRICPACLMADGQILRLEIEFAEHTQGRCSLVPIVIGADTPEWETGQDWFKRQPEDVQRKILGPGRFDAYQDGQFGLDALITERKSSVWGDSLVPTPLKDLVDA